MRNAKYTIAVCGLIAVVATIAVYFLVFDKVFAETVRWSSLLFLLTAELILTVKGLSVKGDLFRQATVYTSVVHIAASVVLAIVYIGSFPNSIKGFCLVNVIMLCALAILDLLVIYFSNHVGGKNYQLAHSQAVVDVCYSKAQSLVVLFDQSEYKEDLASIADMIKYSDNSKLTADEGVILNRLEELEGLLLQNSSDVPALIKEIKSIIKLRTIKMQSMNRGGY